MTIKEAIKNSTQYKDQETFMAEDIDKITRELHDEGVIDYYLQEIRFGLGCMVKDNFMEHFYQFDIDNTGAIDSLDELVEFLEDYQEAVKEHKNKIAEKTVEGKYFITRIKSKPSEDLTIELYNETEKIESVKLLNKEDWSDMKKMGYWKYQELGNETDEDFDEWYENVYLDHFRGNETMTINE